MCANFQRSEQQRDHGAAPLRLRQPHQALHPHRQLQQAAVRPGEILFNFIFFNFNFILFKILIWETMSRRIN